MKVIWFSAGVSSFIAGYIERKNIDMAAYIHIDNQHPDSIRFLEDCQYKIEKPISIMQSRYKSVDNVIETFQFISSAYGAKCTEILKKRVRKEWEYGKTDLTYVWGYDCTERHRAERLIESMPEFKHIFPLIERNLTKEDCHGMCRELKIKRPAMYDLGYQNNNCIGCVKGGMGYWNKIRIDFPDVFKKRSEQERMIGHSCIKDCFLDELEIGRGDIGNEIMEDCGIMCMIAENELSI